MKKILLVLAIVASSLMTTGCEDLLKNKEEVAPLVQGTPGVNDTIVRDAIEKIRINSENDLSGLKKEGDRWIIISMPEGSIYGSYKIVENKFISTVETKLGETFIIVKRNTVEVAKDGKITETLEEANEEGIMKISNVKTHNNVDEYLKSIKI